VTRLHLSLGQLDADVRAAVPRADSAAAALWRRDASLWSADPHVQKAIANRLGWLDSPHLMASSIDRLTSFAAGIRDRAFTDVVLLGMGGSSLAPEVLRAIVGVGAGWPRFHMLDSTDPAAVRAAATPPTTTLYILASKSGGTIEPNSLAAHFRARLEGAGVANWADQFVAITDDGTALATRARHERFRDVFINPSDIGGRYSALSFFGMVPAALMGQNLSALISGGEAMLSAAKAIPSSIDNPAVALGLVMATAAKKGRDKLTLLLPDRFESFGLWVEQLVAESTGKQGVGIVPVAGEKPADASAYGSDRLFVDARPQRGTLAPAISIDWKDPLELGAEFVRWEIATAVAGALLGINPFDEPNVQQAKDATRVLLDRYNADGRLPQRWQATLNGRIALTLSEAAKKYIGAGGPDALLTVLRQGDYFALLAYVGPDDALARELRDLRRAVRDHTRAATMFGYGPRYLHSTGQLHKGGPNTGVFLLITTEHASDVEIPGQPFSFGTLEHAQALGDFQSLDAAGRRALHAHLAAPDAALVRQLADALLAHARSG
jgi:glucose-6-phosphate isomerase